MKRSVKVTTKFLTQKKQNAINALLQSYRSAVNFYIKSLWITPGKLDKETLSRLSKDKTRLSERYKSNALKQALEIVISTKKAAKVIKKYVSVPVYNGPLVLDAKFITIEEGKKSFDLIIKLSSLNKGNRITIPTRHTKMTRKWLSVGKFIQGASINEKGITLWVNVPDQDYKTEGTTLGIDIGYLKMLATSDNKFYGTEFSTIIKKISRRKPGSKGKLRSIRERENCINRNVNLFFKDNTNTSVIGVEDLHDMKRGKKPNRSRNFRKTLASWTYRQVLNRILCKTQENRIRLVTIDPANTSRCCPVCNMVSAENRRGEVFKCVACNYTEDSDYVGALNIFNRTQRFLGSVESPRGTKGN